MRPEEIQLDATLAAVIFKSVAYRNWQSHSVERCVL